MSKKIIPTLLFLLSYAGLFFFGFFILDYLKGYLHNLPLEHRNLSRIGSILIGPHTSFYYLIPVVYTFYAAWITIVIAFKKRKALIQVMSKILPIAWFVFSLFITILAQSLWKDYLMITQYLVIFFALSALSAFLYIYPNGSVMLILFPLSALLALSVTITKVILVMHNYAAAFLFGDPIPTIASLIPLCIAITLFMIFQRSQISLDKTVITRVLMFWTGIWLYTLQILTLWILTLHYGIGSVVSRSEVMGTVSSWNNSFIVISVIIGIIMFVWMVYAKRAKEDSIATS